MIMEGIRKIKDQNVQELLLAALSGAADYNNMFCKYNATYRNMQNLFAQHVYWPTMLPTENNVWGVKLGKGTFTSSYQKIRKAKVYCYKPFEKIVDTKGKTSKVYTWDPVKAEIAVTPEELTQKDALLYSRTAEDLSFLEPESVDAIITDPPYCDNVMYAELADFFYVWLRLALKDRYACFKPELSPKAREIIKNEAQGKDEDFFFRALTRAFAQCHRVLRNDGLFVFTFHHAQTWAWKCVLKAILEAGFYVVAVYPIHSESPDRTHKGISYDIPFVCRKRLEESRPTSWESLKDEIYFAAQESVERLKSSRRELSDADLFVIVMGRCLELYSKHWPNIFKEGQRVDVDQAVDDLDDLVDSLIKSYELKLLPASLDETTKLYLLYIAGQKTVSADDLRKRLVTGGGNLDLFIKRGYLLTKRKRMTVATPSQRMAFIEREMERDRDLPLIDIAHHLYATYQAGQPVQWFLGRWTRDELVSVLEHLYRKSGDRVWRNLAELTRSALAPTTRPLL